MRAYYGDERMRHGMRRAAVRRCVAPLRTAFWTWSVLVALAIGAGAVWAVQHGCGDWRVFVAAGSLAGTRALVEPPDAWRIFVYPPALAWAFAPFAGMPLPVSFVVNAVLMLACAAAAGAVAARVYGLNVLKACAAFVLWPPVMYAAAIIGQNAPFGLLLAQLAIAGFATRSPLLTAIPIGLLLYKPTYALPFVVLLVVRGRRRELGIVAAIAALWYLASVPAAGGAWDWPLATLRTIARYAPGDLSVNGAFAIGLPGWMLFAGAGVPLVICCTAILAAGVLVALRRAPVTEAAAAAALAGLALNPHAWAYDAALAAPMIAYVVSRIDEPARTRALVALAAIAPLFFIAPQLRFDPLALVVVGGTLARIAVRLRRPSAQLA
jgi:Glycosyltransferase family 87